MAVEIYLINLSWWVKALGKDGEVICNLAVMIVAPLVLRVHQSPPKTQRSQIIIPQYADA